MAMVNITPKMTANNVPITYTIITNSEYSESYQGWKALDGSDSSYWCTKYDAGYGEFILKRNNGDSFHISNIKIDTNNINYDWNKLTIFISDDGELYREIFSEKVIGFTKDIDLGVIYKCKFIKMLCEEPAIGSTGGFSMYTLTLRYDDEYLYDGEVNPLSIHKTLKENLPQSISALKDEIHFTEDGEIYISKKDGKLMKCYSNIVASVGLDKKEW